MIGPIIKAARKARRLTLAEVDLLLICKSFALHPKRVSVVFCS